MKYFRFLLAGLALLFLPLSAEAGSADKKVWGGGKQGASSYTDKIVPAVIGQLEGSRLGGYQWGGVSQGTVDNAGKVTANPTHLALGQMDILTRIKGKDAGNGTTYQFTVLQENIGPECLYLVTKNKNYTSWGHVLGNAWDIIVATGGKLSGSFGTWETLAELYPDLQDAEVLNVGGTDKIVQAVSNGSATFGFFVMRPDPASAIFGKIAKEKMTLVPVVDFDLEGVYDFKSLKVAYGGLFSSAKTHMTSCTTVALITGDPANPAVEGKKKRRLDATIKRVGSISEASFQEAVTAQFGGTWKDFLDGFKEVSSAALKQAMEASKAAAEAALKEAGKALEN